MQRRFVWRRRRQPRRNEHLRASGEPCCNGTACNAGLTCHAGTCDGDSGTIPGADSGSIIDSGSDSTIGDAASEAGDASPDATLGDDANDAAPDAGDAANEPGDAANEAGDAGPIPPSCQTGGAGIIDCPGGPNDAGESCCTSLEVTGGTYFRTYDPYNADWTVTLSADGGPTGEADPASVSAFRLDKYEITVGRFRQFVNAVSPPDGGAAWMPTQGSGRHTHLNGGMGLASGPNVDAGQTYETGWDTSWNSNVTPSTTPTGCLDPGAATWTTSVGAQELLPINCVNWYEVYAFCIWDGGFLPSEAEWEYAAAGGDQQRQYPWGSTDPGAANEYAIYGCYYPGGTGACDANSSQGPIGTLNIASVGSARLGAGRWGQLDLAGNLFENALDSYASYVNPCVDCAYLGGAVAPVVRGGDDFDVVYQTFGGSGAASDTAAEARAEIRPTFRDNNGPTTRTLSTGGRCARTP